MKYVPLPIAMLEVGRPLPINVVSESGVLLLGKGQPIVSEQHRNKLHAFNASASLADSMAWQHAYERMVHEMLRGGADLQQISQASMPAEIRESDYLMGETMRGDWGDLQYALRGILYQGGLAMNPMQRLLGIEQSAQTMLDKDADDSLFFLFQALTDETLGYCATHALLCTAVCRLTAAKLGISVREQHTLLLGALCMNIGMARAQDVLARQKAQPSPEQRTVIEGHSVKSVEMLASLGVDDPDLLDLVRWHHAPESKQASSANGQLRQILHLADIFVARTAARSTRAALAPIMAVKAMVQAAQGEALGLSSAMAQAVGFYPPGSFVKLANGDTAVSVQRGARANTPWVVSILDQDAKPYPSYTCKNSGQADYAIVEPVKVRFFVNRDRVRAARRHI